MLRRTFPRAVLRALLAAACVRVSTTRLAASSFPVRSDSVTVFATRAPAEYHEVAVLRTHRFRARDAHVLRAPREHAARLGANGLLLESFADEASRERGRATEAIAGASPELISGPSDAPLKTLNSATPR